MNVIKQIPQIPLRRPDTNKGDYGKVLILASSPGFTGAAYLAGKGALLSGSGLVTVGCPKSLLPVLASKFTCVMTLPLPETNTSTLSRQALSAVIAKSSSCDVIAAGPGIGTHKSTRTLIHALLSKLLLPVVVDADGLNNIAGNCKILFNRKAPTIITPHPGEMSHLTGLTIKDIQKNREETACRFSKQYKVITVLKGHNTVVTDGERLYLNKTG
ncbi:MAG: NAD(P)H-hydrate dehydratase, partial [Planctomycetota bacterium]